MDDNKKSYYAIIPANVRYDKSLNANAKLLYGEITALSNEKGYCWASNAYFAGLYEVSTRAIQEWLKRLRDNGYINIQLIYREGGKEIQQRFIYIAGKGDSAKESSSGHEENFAGGMKKTSQGHEENFADNTTSNITDNTTKNNVVRPKNKLLSETSMLAFNHFWELYDYKVRKEDAIKSFSKIDENQYPAIMEHVKKYVKATKKDYLDQADRRSNRAHPATYLNGKRWNDEIVKPGSPGSSVEIRLIEKM